MRAVCILLLSVIMAMAQAQAPDSTVHFRDLREHHDEITMLTGYQQGRYGFVEFGLGRNIWGSSRHPYDLAYYAGAELRVDRSELIGVKVGGYVDGGSAMGVQIIQYFDGPDHCTITPPGGRHRLLQVQGDLCVQRGTHEGSDRRDQHAHAQS